jgi:hypothetical protein
VAEHRHKRETDARRLLEAVTSTRTVSAGLAALATTGVVAAGVLGAPASRDLVVARAASTSLRPTATVSASADASERFVVSRSASRKERKQSAEETTRTVRKPRADRALAATAAAVREADTRLWTTVPLNLWTRAGGDAVMVGEIPASHRVLVTGRDAGDRVEVVLQGKSRWVTAGYLSEAKPVGVDAGLSMAPCPYSGESGLTPNAVLVFRSVCHAFPQITSYGGWDDHGEHASGRALDIMTSDVALGTAIADFLRSHAAELHLYDILWRQHIWTPVRAGEGWRYMSSRGSATANHYDHVHVSVY